MYKTPSHPASGEEQNLPATAPGKAASSQQAAGTRSGCVDSTELLRGQKTVEISHNGSTYRLQATRLGKLILTK
jgi:hemin uptake protein HemP